MKLTTLLPRVLVTLVTVALAAVIGWYLWDYYMERPWTRDGRVRADVVQIAPDVSGLVTQVMVADNQKVHAGDVLFTIDRERFQLALDQSKAILANRRENMEQQRRDAERLDKLSNSVIAQAEREQQESELVMAEASYRQALADLQLAKLNLERTEVHATRDGYITNLELHAGDYVQAGQAALALVDSNSFHVVGYFEETKLPRIHPGDRVSIALMSMDRKFEGRVVSIASGIVDRERSQSPDLLANINPTFTWVRLAQRIPVRISFDHLPEDWHPAAGLTATVSVLGE